MDDSRVKTILRALNITAFVFLVACLLLLFVWPEHLATMKLTVDEGRMLVLQSISLSLLLGGFQASLHAGWRRLSLAAAFVVLSEASLIAWLLPGT